MQASRQAAAVFFEVLFIPVKNIADETWRENTP
jgi:hypothetical protein